MAQGVAYLVFLIPVVISVPVATYVLSDVLAQPGRELNMWPSVQDGEPHQRGMIGFVDMNPSYPAGEPINITANILNPVFDCGDVYITIYDSEDVAISQGAFFNQCFVKNQSLVPVGDEFSQTITTVGTYTVVLEILDKEQKHVESTSILISIE